ncbi:hypothetical protein ACLB2K_014424 [Fragaria x ananassa]
MVDDDHVYRVMELDSPDDLKLFELKAFKENSSREAYSDLSRVVVDYAKGIPLALTVLGSTFRHCNSVEEWGDELKKLKKFPNKKIHDVLRLSYNRLEENEKGIFCYANGQMDVKRRIDRHRRERRRKSVEDGYRKRRRRGRFIGAKDSVERSQA